MEEQGILIRKGIAGTPGGIRTPDLLLRRSRALTHSTHNFFSFHSFTPFRGFCFRSKRIPFRVNK